MEEIFLRFTHLNEPIFKSLDNQSLANCKEVSKGWYFYLDTQKFVKPRIIEANIKKVREAVEIVKGIYQCYQLWDSLQPYAYIADDTRCAKEDAIFEIFLNWYDKKHFYHDRCMYNKDKENF